MVTALKEGTVKHHPPHSPSQCLRDLAWLQVSLSEVLSSRLPQPHLLLLHLLLQFLRLCLLPSPTLGSRKATALRVRPRGEVTTPSSRTSWEAFQGTLLTQSVTSSSAEWHSVLGITWEKAWAVPWWWSGQSSNLTFLEPCTLGPNHYPPG